MSDDNEIKKTAKRQKEQKTTNLSPIKLELVVTVVEKKKADFYADLIQSFGANVQIKVLSKGTASESVLDYLGLAETDKITLFSVVRKDKIKPLMETLEEKFRTIKKGRGISAVVPLSSVIGKLAFGFLSGEQRMIEGD